MKRRLLLSALAGAAAIAVACSDHTITGGTPGPGQGTVSVQMTDAPLVFDSVQSVNIFVVRIDARKKVADSAEVDDSLDMDHDGHSGMEDHDSTAWVTIASPDSLVNVLALRNGVQLLLGQAAIDSGHFHALRIVIDPSKSNVTLKNGTVLTATSNPPIEFFGTRRRGIGVILDNDFDVRPGHNTTILIDFRLDQSFGLRGHSLGHDGLLFFPLLHCTSHHDD